MSNDHTPPMVLNAHLLQLLENCTDPQYCRNGTWYYQTFNGSYGEYIYVDQEVSFWQSTTAEYEVGDFFPMERGRGRGRSGRGRRGSGSRGRRGRGSRGGRGQRGKRTQRGDRLEPDRVDLLREEKKRKANVPQLVICVVLFVFIVFGNTSVLVAIGLSETGRKTRMNFFILNLAIADLTVGLFHVTIDIAEKCIVVWYGGAALCKIVRFLQVLVVYSSTFMLVSLSIDRVDAIARPMNFTRKAMTIRALVYAAWITAAVLALPALLLFDTVYHSGDPYCIMTLQERWQWQFYVTTIALTAFVIPALIIVTCYGIIIFVIWDKGRGFSNAFRTPSYRPPAETDAVPGSPAYYEFFVNYSRRTLASRQHRGRGSNGIIPQAKIRTVKMTLIIVAVFVISWSPYFIFNLLDVYGSPPLKSEAQLAVTSLIQSLAPLNSAANPIIYGIFSSRICSNLRRIPFISFLSDLLCRCPIKRQNSRGGITGSHTEHTYIDAATGKPILRRCVNGHRLFSENENSTLMSTGQGLLYPVHGSCAYQCLNHNRLMHQPKCQTKHKTSSSKNKQNGFYHRRPSGLPLANRKMTSQETIILETYRVSCARNHERNKLERIACSKSKLNREESTANEAVESEFCNGSPRNETILEESSNCVV